LFQSPSTASTQARERFTALIQPALSVALRAADIAG